SSFSTNSNPSTSHPLSLSLPLSLSFYQQPLEHTNSKKSNPSTPTQTKPTTLKNGSNSLLPHSHLDHPVPVNNNPAISNRPPDPRQPRPPSSAPQSHPLPAAPPPPGSRCPRTRGRGRSRDPSNHLHS
ncbi:hypothetical protein K457DRAFT_151422, partial [Linnemannia elongata AG-77]